MGTIRVGGFNLDSIVDGPGRRAVVFVQGCSIRCPFCQSPHLHDPCGGTEMDVNDVADKLLATGLDVTISGGEPFDQAWPVADLMIALHTRKVDVRIVLYTGYTLDYILAQCMDRMGVTILLRMADSIVDGPYVEALDHDWMQWRGSANQRPIRTETSEILGWRPEWGELAHYLDVLDWNTQVLTVDAEGNIVGTAGAIEELFAGEGKETRMCGQSREA